jgi:3-hydroxyisobutyrate dehydrogenase-like beta-hydroxyacid dehydrogenase
MSAERPRIGFVGVGAMGLPMARNLLRADFPVAFSTSRDSAASALNEAGGIRLGDPVAVAAASDVLMTCLPTDVEIEAVLLGPESALEALRPGGTLIELSTASPELMRRIEERAATRGVAMLDAPVSGGVSGAEAGTLSIMVGGDKDILDVSRPVLDSIGGNIYHVGPVGMGKVFKLCNQYLVGATTALVGEALTMAAKAGADLPLLVEVVSSSSGASRALTGAAPTLLSPTPTPVGFRLDLMRKDIGLALALGSALRAPLATGSVAYQLYSAASAAGLGDRNYAELGALLAQLVGASLSSPPASEG